MVNHGTINRTNEMGIGNENPKEGAVEIGGPC